MAELENKYNFPIEHKEIDVEKERKKQKIRTITIRVVVYLFLTIFAILSILPFYWMIISSITTETQYRGLHPSFFPTQGLAWANYKAVINFNGGLFSSTLINTLVIGFISTVVGVILTILTAYAFARLKFKGKEVVFTLMLFTMMIPGELYTITNYATATKWKMTNTYVILIVPFLVNFYYIYLLRNNFKQIPESLYKAAKVDGTSDMGYLFKVMVPLTIPTIISITLLRFIGTWNSYIWPRLVNNNEQWQMITNWVTQDFLDYTFHDPDQVMKTWKMAAACMVTLPLLILFLCFRKYIMKGVSKSGTKG